MSTRPCGGSTTYVRTRVPVGHRRSFDDHRPRSVTPCRNRSGRRNRPDTDQLRSMRTHPLGQSQSIRPPSRCRRTRGKPPGPANHSYPPGPLRPTPVCTRRPGHTHSWYQALEIEHDAFAATGHQPPAVNPSSVHRQPSAVSGRSSPHGQRTTDNGSGRDDIDPAAGGGDQCGHVVGVGSDDLIAVSGHRR